MQSIRLKNTGDPDWAVLWKVYETSFPREERRTRAAQKTIMNNPRYHFEMWRSDDEPIGLTAWWKYERFSFLEHFAVHPRRRSGGLGRKILTCWMRRPHPLVLLEIDTLTDEISRRRWNFYERLGFLDNGIAHSHPSYYDGMGKVPLLVLSYPDRIERELYEEFAKVEREEMLAHLKLS